MVGGGSRVLEVREAVKKYFGGKDLDYSVDADLAISEGAAIQGAIIGGLI
jgi:molecular chaperone DnaK